MANIVVIEDDPLVRNLIVDTLEAEGYRVLGVGQGPAGLEMVIQYLPDLVLCDITMPEMDGYAILQAIRHNPETKTTLFIFLTAHGDRHYMRKGMELGADDYITKPFTHNELTAAINAQLAKRNIINQQHESTLRMLRRNIIYALPHELRTPLAIILGNSDLLADEEIAYTPEEVRRMAHAISNNGRRLHRLFENYLIYAQIELIAADKKHLEALRNHIVKDAARIVEAAAVAQADDARRRGDLVVTTVPVALAISEENLTKIVEELVSNAFKFSETGTPVRVTMAREGGYLFLVVADEGRGMTPEQIEHIGAYMQFGRAVYEQQGLGLGLAIAQRLAELHHGAVTIDSAPGQGTTITVRFPV